MQRRSASLVLLLGAYAAEDCTWTGPFEDKYLSGWAADVKEVFENLADAEARCMEHGPDCSGVTLASNGQYTPRKYSNLMHGEHQTSWVKSCEPPLPPPSWRMPRWSWDTLNVFWHSCNTSAKPYTDEQVAILAKYNMVTFDSKLAWHKTWAGCEKGGCDTGSNNTATYEGEVVKLFKRIKAIDPTVMTAAYWNTHLAYHWYEVGMEVDKHPEWWVYDLKGQPAVSGNIANGRPKNWNWANGDAYNAAKLSIRKNLIKPTMQDGTPVVDGLFFDGGSKGTKACSLLKAGCWNNATWNRTYWDARHLRFEQEVQSEFPGVCITGSQGGTVDHIAGTQSQNFGEGGVYHGIHGINRTMWEGKIFQADGGGMGRCKCGGDPYHPVVQTEVAAFLLTANKYAYYGQGGFTMDIPVWYPVYDMPIGEPLSNATKVNATAWRREFSKGTVIEFDFATWNGTVRWGSHEHGVVTV